jgi:hypothetical protein
MIADTLSKVRQLIRGRKYAYQMVFDKQNKFTEVVLKDLARFCRAHDTTFDKDPRRHAALEGRREVFLRIQEYLQLTEDEILNIHRVKEISFEAKR